MSSCLIGLGSNLGDRHQTLERAINLLIDHAQIDLIAKSGFYETPAIGGPANQNRFLNAAVRLQTSLTPTALHAQLLRTENDLGRQRRVRWDSRTVDLDLLLYDDQVLDLPELTVPHPRMAFRSFVLAPAAEVAGAMIHPVIGRSLQTLWQQIRSQLKYCAVTGGIGAGKTRLVREVIDRLKHQHQLGVQFVEEALPEEMLAAYYVDSAGHGWDTEIEFLRRRQLALDRNRWSSTEGWLLSDFWFQQSLAFAKTALDSRRYASFVEAWRDIDQQVIQPTLLVVLTADTPALVEAIGRRGRACEESLTDERVEQLSQSLDEVVTEAVSWPRLVLKAQAWQQAVDEVIAAILAIEAVPVRLSSCTKPASRPMSHISIGLPQVFHKPDEMRDAIQAARLEGKRIGIVPTMGALHEGHLSLVQQSASQCGLTVVSIFVNPTQFCEGEDFGKYPRDLADDLARLAGLSERGELIVFAPPVEVVYPDGFDTRVIVGAVARPLEGRCRPGHFEGVATVVLKLFQLVPADVAFFGQKDYQQALVIRQMVRDLNLRVQIEVGPTVRDTDGLALSSRNQYLTSEQREQGLSLSRSLKLAADQVRDGERDARKILRSMREVIQSAGDVRIDYVALADPQTLRPVSPIEGPVAALVAVRVGSTRLIDNAILQVP
ncbi:MAG: pantoate--beta-alanine ligase [Pirellulales bacterium]